ncbi:helix-turn-helix transcriptional regulator [Streptomyces sp. NBC_01477]|nr:helix-turn-helix transcriptional regulator [Streptomyces sp. NBC_01477]
MPALWTGTPTTVRPDDLDIICPALKCTTAESLLHEPEIAAGTAATGPPAGGDRIRLGGAAAEPRAAGPFRPCDGAAEELPRMSAAAGVRCLPARLRSRSGHSGGPASDAVLTEQRAQVVAELVTSLVARSVADLVAGLRKSSRASPAPAANCQPARTQGAACCSRLRCPVGEPNL